MQEIWSDTNRFNQTGYSAPTIFPEAKNYSNIANFLEDYDKAQFRQEAHLEWVWEQEQEARQEWKEYQAELKASREEWN